MSTARWRHQTSDVPMDSINVFHAGLTGFDVQLGSEVLWVSSQAHFEDIVAKVRQCFASLPPRRLLPPRTDSVKPTDYTTVNCSGACYGGDDE